MNLGNPFDNREAKSKSASCSGSRAIATIETVEQIWQVRGRNAAAGIRDADADTRARRDACGRFRAAAQADAKRAALRHGLQGIRDQINENLPEFHGKGHDQSIGFDSSLDRDAIRLYVPAKCFQDVVQDEDGGLGHVQRDRIDVGPRPDPTPASPNPRAPMIPGTFSVLLVGQ